MRFLPFAVCALVAAAVFFSCRKEPPAKDTAPEPDVNYSFNYQNFSTGGVIPGVTNGGARLGRVLFYDKRLSLNNTVACGTCHKQNIAFSDNVALSNGFNGGKTGRNSMPIINPQQSKGFFWDHRTQKLQDMVLQPIRHEVEMGLDNTEFLVKKLEATTFYPRLFNEAFGSSEITREKIGSALAQFINAMFSQQTRADKAGVLNGGWNILPGILTTDEIKGSNLFQQKGCEGCHAGINLRGWGEEGFANIGLDEVYADKGLGALMSDPTLDGHFKIPSLRNVELTAPYMHDGRYKTLEEVVEHYNSAIKYSSTLSLELREWDPVSGQPLEKALRLNLTEDEKRCLVAFLKTLTDHTFISDPKFSDPFR